MHNSMETKLMCLAESTSPIYVVCVFINDFIVLKAIFRDVSDSKAAVLNKGEI